MRNKLFGVLLVVCIICLSTSFVVQAEPFPYVAIVDLKTETEVELHKTYTVQDAIVELTCNISLPDVSRIPVLRIATIPSPAASSQKENPRFYSYGIIQRIEGRSVDVNRVPGIGYIMADGHAEASPLSLEEASAFVLDTVSATHESYQAGHFALWGGVGHSRQYAQKGDLEYLNDESIDYDHPQNERGDYELLFSQAFEGIPLYPWSYFGIIDAAISRNTTRPPQIWANVYDADEYYIMISCAEVLETIAEDTPLLPFHAIWDVLEKEVLANRLRQIYDIRLTYMAFYDAQMVSETMVLFPVWIVTGDYYEQAGQASRTSWGNYDLRTRAIGEMRLAINAQTGVILSPENVRMAKLDLRNIAHWNNAR